MSNPSDFIIENGELTKYLGPGGDVVIPEGVTSIGGWAFSSCISLTSVIIPEGVTSINIEAFGCCRSLTSATIPDSVTSIGVSAFEKTALSEDESHWENGVLYLGKHLIKAKGTLTDAYEIRQGTRCISDSAFYNCSSLTSVTIPESVTSIGDRAFYNCSSLTSVTIPETVTCIGESAFENTALSEDESHWENDVLYLGKHLIKAKGTLTDAYEIRQGTRCIGNSAFYNCSSLTSVTIPESVTSIGESAFCYCSSLTSVTIPAGVTSINNAAFECCRSLTSVTIPEGVTSIGNSAFYNCSSLTSVTIPESVTSIGERAFCYCSSLTSVTILEGVTRIGYAAFEGCYSLTSVAIPEGVTSIGDRAFSGCSSLTSVTIPEGVTSIGDWAFSKCIKLESLSIPRSLSKIGNETFKDCEKLNAIHLNNCSAKLPLNVFGQHMPDALKNQIDSLYLYLGDGALKQYVFEKEWNTLDSGLQAEIFLARQGKPLDTAYSECVTEKQLPVLYEAILHKFDRGPTSSDCAAAAGYMRLFYSKVPVEQLKILYAKLKKEKPALGLSNRLKQMSR